MCFPDPFKIFKFVCMFFCIIILIVVMGYVGKGLYIQYNTPFESTYELVRDPSFYVPDEVFWALGITITIALCSLLGLLQFIITTVWKKSNQFLCWVIFFPFRRKKKENYVQLKNEVIV